MNVLLVASKVLMRLGQWHAAATLLLLVPFGSLDGTARGRLSYALLMLHRTRAGRAQHLLQRLVLKNHDASAALLLELATMAVRVQDESLAANLLAQAIAKATDAPTKDAAQTLLAMHTAQTSGTLHAEITAQVEAAMIPAGGMLTLVPVSSRYLDMWALWVAQVRKHIGGTVVALALDDAAMAPLAAEEHVAVVDVRAFFAWSAPGSLHEVSRGVLWQVRTLVLCELVLRGRSVLVLDLDAVAVGDVIPLLDAMPDTDVIAQEDHSIPMDVNRQLGFILCCGFMLWRPTAAARALVERFAAEAMVERDDQLALNHILGREGITAKTAKADWMAFESAGVMFACPAPALVSRTLSGGTVVRHFQQEGHSVAELRAALGLGS